jgi:hypothetical protein
VSPTPARDVAGGSPAIAGLAHRRVESKTADHAAREEKAGTRGESSLLALVSESAPGAFSFSGGAASRETRVDRKKHYGERQGKEGRVGNSARELMLHEPGKYGD